MRAGTAYTFQRARRNGQVYSIHGQPMTGGGFVTTYTDITEFKRHEQALLEAKQGLEERVAQRTQELSAALEAQRMAKQQAEAANASKTRFVAAASHDLLQPLNAARLFVSALESRAAPHPELQELAGRIDGSMRAAEELLNDLLDIARLDSGVLRPDITSFPITELLEELRRQYAPLAQARHLRLSIVDCREVVRSDRVLLRRIIQNYLSNALRYTRTRRRRGRLPPARRRTRDRRVRHRARHRRAAAASHVRRVQPSRAGLALGREGPGAGPVDLRSPGAADGPHADIRQPPGARLGCSACGCRATSRRAALKRIGPQRAGRGPDRPARPARAVRGQRLFDPRWHGGAARTMGRARAQGPKQR